MIKRKEVYQFLSRNNVLPTVGRVFSAVVPGFVLLLCYYPLVVGLFTNYELIEIRQNLLLLLWIPFLSLPYLFSRKKIFYYLLVILSFVNGFVHLGHWILIKAPISASGLFVVFNTNFKEALGFAQLKGSYEYLLVLPYLVILFLALRYPPKIGNINKATRNITAVVLFAYPLIIVLSYTFKGLLIEKGTPIILKTVIAYKKELKAYKELKDHVNMDEHKVQAHPIHKNQPEVVVLIIGESLNRNHMSIYGSSDNTSPLLSKRNDIIVYQDVVSGYTHTMTSVPASLTQANLENKLSPPNSITLADVFRAAGYKTYWLSNQSPMGVWDNLITLLAQQYEVTDFVNTTGNSSHETLKKNSLDSKLFDPLQTALKDQATKKLIVLHLIGCHATYDTRYPKEFDKLTVNTSTDWPARNRSFYLNAVLYNDYIVDSLLNIVSEYCDKNNEVGSALYISDHGENVYDDGDYAGHDYSGTAPKSLVEIPFIVWLSPEYKRVFPEKSATIKSHYLQPYVTDDLFYSVIDLSGIQTPVFKPKRSVFNPNFNNKRERSLVDGEDYDKK